MKRVLVFILAVMMSMSYVVAFSEEGTDTATAQVEQSVAELTSSTEEDIYKEYFNKAFVIVNQAHTIALHLSNFFYINNHIYSPIPASDLAFLVDLESPLELTETQMQTLYKYKSNTELNRDYKSYSDSSLSATVALNTSLPAYLTVFTLLEKPVVPEKFAYVDSCVDNAISDVELFIENVTSYLSGTTSNIPSYNETMYEYVEMVYTLIN